MVPLHHRKCSPQQFRLGGCAQFTAEHSHFHQPYRPCPAYQTAFQHLVEIEFAHHVLGKKRCFQHLEQASNARANDVLG
jgi:hypothetical protein